jgi:O-antigen ligase
MTPHLQRAAALLLAAFFALALVVERSASALAFVMAAAGFVLLALPATRRRLGVLGREEKLLFFAFGLFFAVAAVSFLLRGFHAPGVSMLGRYARFLMVVPIFFLVRFAAPGRGLVFGALFAGAALAGGLSAMEIVRFDGEGPLHVAGGTRHHILFGCGSVVIAFGSLAAMGWLRRRHVLLAAIPIAFLGLGLLGAVASGSRGAWAAVPVLLLLFALTPAPLFGRLLRGGLLGGALCLGLIAWAVPGTGVSARIDRALEDVREYREGGRRTTSVGSRFEMWRASVVLFGERPVFGVGIGGYAEATEALLDDHGIEAIAARWNNPHNEYLSILVTRGLIGLGALLLFFGVPAMLFGRASRSGSAEVQAFGFAGLSVVVAYSVFGLSESIFERNFPITLYTVFVASMWAMVRLEERRAEEAMGERRQTLSAIVVTCDEADRIAACLDSLSGLADEIVVLDSGSEDETVAICRRYTEKVEVTDWPGYGVQKQRALERATGDWVLSIDADERVTPEARAEIEAVLRDPAPACTAFRIVVAAVLYGKRLDFGRAGPSPIRLFRREGARFDEAVVHEAVIPAPGRVGRLRGRLAHLTHRSYAHGAAKLNRYAALKAEEKAAAGARGGIVWGALRAGLEFLTGYVLRLGFLDGRRGLLMAVMQAQYVFDTQAGIWALRQAGREEDDPAPKRPAAADAPEETRRSA